MAIPDTYIEERLSVSFVGAIVSESGYLYDIPGSDFGVDLSIRRVKKSKHGYIDLGVVYDLQLKATYNWSESGNDIIYDMDATAYNKLILRNNEASTPCFLTLFCLPPERSRWLEITDSELIMRKSCYYYYLSGDETGNRSGKRIKIPKSNLISTETINKLSNEVLQGDYL
jgi:hypothetical protein